MSPPKNAYGRVYIADVEKYIPLPKKPASFMHELMLHVLTKVDKDANPVEAIFQAVDSWVPCTVGIMGI